MFGERLRELREGKKIPQRLLAEKLGVTQQAVAKWENDKAEPDIATINKLADFFEVDANYLLGRTGVPTSINTDDLPETVAPYLAEGISELTPEARKEVMDFIEYVKVKYAKKEGDDKR